MKPLVRRNLGAPYVKPIPTDSKVLYHRASMDGKEGGIPREMKLKPCNL